MIRKTLPFGAIMALALSANAAVIINISQVGPDVVVTGSGSVNTAGLTQVSAANFPALMDTSLGVLLAGTSAKGTIGFWVGASFAGSSIGPGDQTTASIGTGDLFGVFGSDVALPIGYVSGTPLSASSTFTDTTLSDLGLNVGSTVYSWGSGPTADSLTITVVPEPHQYAMLAGLGLVGLGLWRRHARR